MLISISSTHNSALAIGSDSSSLDSFVVAESSGLPTNLCAESPAIDNAKTFVAN
jgi:hypothetical protein